MPPPRRPTTDAVPRQSQRVKKAPSLPGVPEAPPKRKRTKEEVQREREEKEAEKAEKARKNEETLQLIADLESRMAADDAKTNQGNRPKPIRRTHSIHNLESPLDEEDLYFPSEEAPSVQESEGNAASTDGEEPQKKTKVPFRASIQAIHKAQASSVAQTNGEKMMVDREEVRTGQTRGSTTDANSSTKDWDDNVRKWAASVKGPRPITQSNVHRGTGGQSTKSSHVRCPQTPTLTSASSIAPEIHAKDLDAQILDLDITPKATKIDHYGVMVTPGGFNDEEEEGERAAALSSPIKSGRRLTSTAIIDVKTPPQPIPKSNGGGKKGRINAEAHVSHADRQPSRTGTAKSEMVSTARKRTMPLEVIDEVETNGSSVMADSDQTRATKSETVVTGNARKRTKLSEQKGETSESIAGPDERRTASGIVKVEPADAVGDDEKLLKKRAKSSTKSSAKLTNKDLPIGANDNKMYRRRFIPTFIRFAAGYEKCWNIPDTDAIPALQTIWNSVYGSNLLYTVTLNDAVFKTSVQRLYDWRSGFGSVALSVIEAFFDSEVNGTSFKSFAARKQYAKHQLEHLRFLYAEAMGDDPNAFQGVFRSTWISQTLAHHLSFIDGSVKVLLLGEYESPKAALTLAAIAVERGFTLWATDQFYVGRDKHGRSILKLKEVTNSGTGKSSTKSHEFSDANWGPKSQSYFRSIKRLAADSMDDIVQRALPFIKANQKGESSNAELLADADDDDQRANLFDV